MDQSTACDRGHRMDGRDALFAAAVRLSLRCGGRIQAVRNLQGDGTAVAEGNHQPGDDRDLARWIIPCLRWALGFSRLVPRQVAAGTAAVGRPWLFRPLRQEFRRGPKYPKWNILSYYQ